MSVGEILKYSKSDVREIYHRSEDKSTPAKPVDGGNTTQRMIGFRLSPPHSSTLIIRTEPCTPRTLSIHLQRVYTSEASLSLSTGWGTLEVPRLVAFLSHILPKSRLWRGLVTIYFSIPPDHRSIPGSAGEFAGES